MALHGVKALSGPSLRSQLPSLKSQSVSLKGPPGGIDSPTLRGESAIGNRQSPIEGLLQFDERIVAI